MLNRFRFFGILVPLISALATAHAQNAVVVTATNAAQNQLLVYDSTGQLIQTVSTFPPKVRAASGATPAASRPKAALSPW